MSSFKTKVPVDIASVKALLPIDSYVEAVTWNEKENAVEVIWSNRLLRTPFSFHEDFPLELLQAKETPKSVVVLEKPRPVVPPAQVVAHTEPKPVNLPKTNKKKT